MASMRVIVLASAWRWHFYRTPSPIDRASHTRAAAGGAMYAHARAAEGSATGRSTETTDRELYGRLYNMFN
jgi:hypothetical protein